MRLLVLAVLAVLAVCAGCASQPQTAPSSTVIAAAAPAPAPAAAPAETAQAATKAATEFKPPNGYRKRKNGNETVYCRKDTILGSRFPEEFCFNEEQLKEEIRRGEEMGAQAARGARICANPQACGSQ